MKNEIRIYRIFLCILLILLIIVSHKYYKLKYESNNDNAPVANIHYLPDGAEPYQ
jgi:hypothetical protein